MGVPTLIVVMKEIRIIALHILNYLQKPKKSLNKCVDDSAAFIFRKCTSLSKVTASVIS
jgi:hypothetical protein